MAVPTNQGDELESLSMPHEFTEWEHEPEPQPSAARTGGRPPAKPVGIDMLEPPIPSEARTRSNLLRIFAILVLLGLAAAFILWRLGAF